MNNLEVLNEVVTMTSLEVVSLINRFRKEEGNTTKKRHDNLIRDIDKEIEALKKVEIEPFLNFEESYYEKEDKRKYRYYKMNKQGIMQILNRESAVVRYKTQEYIKTLETNLQKMQLQQALLEKDNQIKRLESLIGLRAKDKFQYGKIIKNHLGITKANKDYENIKQMFFYEVNVTKWEDIGYNREYVSLLNEICESYKPSVQLSFKY